MNLQISEVPSTSIRYFATTKALLKIILRT